MLRVIREISPAWVIAENVLGITSMGQSDNSSHLESKEFGYTTETMVLPEIIKSLESSGYEVLILAIPASGLDAPHRRQRIWIIANADPINDRKNSIDREFQGTTKEIEGKERIKNRKRVRPGSGNGNKDDTHIWNKQWPEVVEQLCRVDARLPRRLDKDRTNRLKGLGNAIVPQIAQIIFQYIQDYDEL